MKIKKIQNGSALIISLEGRLDTVTSPELNDELKRSLDNTTELVFDLEKLDYISSAGLRVLLSAEKAMSSNGGIKIIHVSETVMEIFEVTGFSDILDIE